MPGESVDPPAIFVGNVDSDGDAKDLNSLFSKYGVVSSLDVKKGFAFVFMPDRKAAEDAIAAINGTPFGPSSRELRVEWSRGNGVVRRRETDRKNARPNHTLFVANFELTPDSKSVLTKLFEEFGALVRVDIMNHYAFVQYTEVENATTALTALQGKVLNDRTLNVEYSVRNSERGSRGPRHGPAAYGGYGPGPGYPGRHPMGAGGYGNHGPHGGYGGPGMYGAPPYGGPGPYGGYGGGYGGGPGYPGGYGNGYGPPGRGGFHGGYGGGYNGGYGGGGYAGGYGGGGPRHRRRDDNAGWGNIVDERRRRPLSPRRSLSPRRGEGDLTNRRSQSISPARNAKRARRDRSRSRSRSRSPSPVVAKKRSREDRSQSPRPGSDKKRGRHSSSPTGSPKPFVADRSEIRPSSPLTKAEEKVHRSPSPVRNGHAADNNVSRSPSRSRSVSRGGSLSPKKEFSPIRDLSPRAHSPRSSGGKKRSRSSSPASHSIGSRGRSSSDGRSSGSSSPSRSGSARSSSPPPAKRVRTNESDRVPSDGESVRSHSP